MKYILIVLILVFVPTCLFAQKSSLYADAGISLARFYPGTSTTYNYNLSRGIGIGVGFQGYDFHATRTNFQMVPAVYGEIRFKYRQRKKGQFFFFLDIGANFYKKNNGYWRNGYVVYNVKSDNGVYVGEGFGYMPRPKKSGWAHYFSLKMISNDYNVNRRNYMTGERHVAIWADLTFVASVGFKF